MAEEAGGLVAVTHVFEPTAGGTWSARLAVLRPDGSSAGVADVMTITEKQAESLRLLLKLAREG
jgi:hypothetical protein